MAAEHVQTIDLTNFSGRIFFLADPHGHYSALCNLIQSVTKPEEEIVIFSTGNLFDYGPEPIELMKAINSGFFDGRFVRHFSAAGAGEEMLKKLLPLNKDRRTFYPSTYLNERWCVMGGKWHKAVNRYYLEEEVKKLLNTQLGTMMQILLKGDIKIGVCPSDYAPIRTSFTDTYNALQAFNYANVNIFQSQFLFGMDHAVIPMMINDVNLMVLGRNPVNSIRKAHGRTQNNLPVLIGNCLHINTGSLYMSKLEDQVIVAPGIPPTDSPALTLVEIIMKNNPVLLCHQLIQTINKFYSLKTYPLELDSIENNIEVTR
ncbi:hypothetical protein CTA84_20905 [Salmonella enterica]|nr:hypothetical protein [Salmonella enterica]